MKFNNFLSLVGLGLAIIGVLVFAASLVPNDIIGSVFGMVILLAGLMFALTAYLAEQIVARRVQ